MVRRLSFASVATGAGTVKLFARGNIRLNVKILDNRRNGVDILVFERYRVGLGRVVTRFVSRTEVNGVRTGFALGGIAVAVFLSYLEKSNVKPFVKSNSISSPSA